MIKYSQGFIYKDAECAFGLLTVGGNLRLQPSPQAPEFDSGERAGSAFMSVNLDRAVSPQVRVATPSLWKKGISRSEFVK
jgi:hypothetical protein